MKINHSSSPGGGWIDAGQAAIAAAHGTEAGSEVILVSKEVGVGSSKTALLYKGLVRSQESSTTDSLSRLFPQCGTLCVVEIWLPLK